MRTALCLATGLAVVFSGAPASFAQESRVPDPGQPAGTAIEAEQPPTHDEMSDRLRSEAREQSGASVAVPVGRVLVGPEFVGGEHIYLRRAAREGMAIVDVSTTPFAPEYAVADELIVRPDQPASW
jgi:hypothetical protein